MTGSALEIVRALVLADGRRWGDAAEPWQVSDAAAVLSLDGPPLHYLTRPRGASKTSDLAAIAIAVLLEQLPAGSRSYAVAADADQARLLLDALAGFATRTAGLGGALRIDLRRVTAVASGATLEVLAADAASAYGLLPHFVVADELAQWSGTPGARGVWEAVVSAVPKVPGARLVVLTTAGDPAHWSAKVLAHAKRQRRWRVSELAGPTPWIDPAALEEQRELLTESAFARLHLNQWTAPEDRLTTVDDLAACTTLDGPLDPVEGVRYVIGLDVGLTHDRTVVAVCHADGPPEGRRVVLDRMQVWAGRRGAAAPLEAVQAFVEEVSKAYNAAPVVFDIFQAAQMTQTLAGRGVRTVPFTFSAQSVGKLGLRLYQLLRARRLALPDDRDLLDELAHVRIRESSPGVYRLDHDRDRHDDRAVALALAAEHLLSTAGRGGRLRFYGPASLPAGPMVVHGVPGYGVIADALPVTTPIESEQANQQQEAPVKNVDLGRLEWPPTPPGPPPGSVVATERMLHRITGQLVAAVGDPIEPATLADAVTEAEFAAGPPAA